MKITDVETFIFSAAHHNANRNWVIVKINTDDGLYGLGDASGLGNDHQVISLINEMAEAFLIGRDPMDSEAIWTQIYYNNQSRASSIRPGSSRTAQTIPASKNRISAPVAMARNQEPMKRRILWRMGSSRLVGSGQVCLRCIPQRPASQNSTA